jgi:hypothetical protein
MTRIVAPGSPVNRVGSLRFGRGSLDSCSEMAARRRRSGPRERPGREKPGAILRGPPITVGCECGVKHDLDYGERWTCEGCGRTYDSSRIPREEYELVRRTQLRFRVLPVVLGVFVLALAVFFTLTGNVFSVFFLLPLALMAWFALLRPLHRQRYRRAIADLPRWNLRAE